MRERFSDSMKTVAIAGTAVGLVISASTTPTWAQAPAAPGAAPTTAALTTPWGEPDLQGIWTDETDTPLQRSPKYVNQEFSPTPSARSWTGSARPCKAARDARSAGPWPT